jgi:hypothetical protein
MGDELTIAFSMSLEPGEAVFSLYVRHCRVTGVPCVIGGNSPRSASECEARDFLCCTRRLEGWHAAPFSDRPSLLFEHSAALYYTADELPEEHATSLATVRSGLTTAAARRRSCRSEHLRYCPRCAAGEYRWKRYSFWHRDHQLPLTLVCLTHGVPLVDVGLEGIHGSLPHEQGLPDNKDVGLAPALAHSLASLDRSLAVGGTAVWVSRRLGSCADDLDPDTPLEGTALQAALAAGRCLVEGSPLAWIGGMLRDQAAISGTLRWLLGRYPAHADPALGVFMASLLTATTRRAGFTCH